MDPDKLAGVDLSAGEPFIAPEAILEGNHRPRGDMLYWGEELVGPLDVIDEKGYEPVFMTPTGEKPRALPPSMEPGFLDPPLDKVVTDEYYARKTREIDESDRLANPVNLSEWFAPGSWRPPMGAR